MSQAEEVANEVSGAVPPGPGVRPPFLAPPTDGAPGRRWWGIGLGVAVLMAVCLGCGGGVVALGVLGQNMVVEQERGAVDAYLTALSEQRFGAAWAQLCAADQGATGLVQFGQTQEGRPKIATFQVGQPVTPEEAQQQKWAVAVTDAKAVVPAEITDVNGTHSTSYFAVVEASDSSDFAVCGTT